jgi:hypothetical protein
VSIDKKVALVGVATDLKIKLETIKKDKELASISAVIRLLLKKCGDNLSV